MALQGGHLDDGQLLELLDGTESPAGAEHLRQCAECASRMTALASASRSFAAAAQRPVTASLDPRVRMRVLARPARHPLYWRALPLVAGIAFVVASAALAAPVRHWIARQIGISSPAPTYGREPNPDAPPAPPPGGMSVSFAPTYSVLTLRVVSWQRAGSLSFRASESGAVVARLVGGAGADEILVAPGQLTIRNGTASDASYQIALPRQIRLVRLSIAGNERMFDASALGKPLSLIHP